MQISLTGIDAVVLAGGVNTVALYEGYEPGYKALLPLGDKLAIQYTLDALRAVPGVKRIAIVGAVDELRPVLAEHGLTDCVLVPGGDTIMDSIYHGLQHFADSSMVLMVTAQLSISFIFPVPDASVPANEICSERSSAGIISSDRDTE
jgi:2-C-methyl-D-erythritol 4-phosphate cytidylyltransferase